MFPVKNAEYLRLRVGGSPVFVYNLPDSIIGWEKLETSDVKVF